MTDKESHNILSSNMNIIKDQQIKDNFKPTPLNYERCSKNDASNVFPWRLQQIQGVQ